MHTLRYFRTPVWLSGWLLSAGLSLLLISPLHAQQDEISAEELERWFNSDSLEPPRYKEVNEGQLVFLSGKQDKTLHHHHNSVTILPHSLEDGWILIKQCHSNIDRVAAAQVLFKAERVKNIKILSTHHIEKAWVEGASVQMENIGAAATICLQANTRSLEREADGTYRLHNGPFMRRFLDGYFPLRVSLDLNYEQTNLELTDFQPMVQAGFAVTRSEGKLHLDTVFEGKLRTEFHFRIKRL